MWFNSQIKYKWTYFVYFWPVRCRSVWSSYLFINLFICWYYYVSLIWGRHIVFPIVCLSVCLSQIVLAQFILLCFPHLGETYSFSHSCLSVCMSICLSVKSCSLNNSSTLSDTFTKLDKNNSTIRRCAENKYRNSTYISDRIMPLWNI